MAASTTRIFKSGNSLAVRIPKHMVPADLPAEAEIEWNGAAWIVRPLQRRTLAGLMDCFRAFSPDFMAEGREFHEEKERDWSAGADPVLKDEPVTGDAASVPAPRRHAKHGR